MSVFIKLANGNFLNADQIARIERDGPGWVAYDRHGDHAWPLPEGFQPERDLAEKLIPAARKPLAFN